MFPFCTLNLLSGFPKVGDHETEPIRRGRPVLNARATYNTTVYKPLRNRRTAAGRARRGRDSPFSHSLRFAGCPIFRRFCERWDSTNPNPLGFLILPAYATTETAPCGLRVGRTVISTSCPKAVRKSSRRSTENDPARLRINAETWGCLIPRTFRLRFA